MINRSLTTAGIQLSHGDRVALVTGASGSWYYAGSRIALGSGSGRRIYQWRSMVLGGEGYVGLAKKGTTPDYASADSYLMDEQGDVWNNGSSSSYAATWAAGHVQMAVDFSSLKVWFGINGTWYGDPDAGTGEAFTLPTGETFYAYLGGKTNADEFGDLPFTDDDKYPLNGGLGSDWNAWDMEDQFNPVTWAVNETKQSFYVFNNAAKQAERIGSDQWRGVRANRQLLGKRYFEVQVDDAEVAGAPPSQFTPTAGWFWASGNPDNGDIYDAGRMFDPTPAAGGPPYANARLMARCGTGAKQYWEIEVATDNNFGIGISETGHDQITSGKWLGLTNEGIGYWNDGKIYHNNTIIDASPATFAAGDIIGVSTDTNGGQNWFSVYKNGVLQSSLQYSTYIGTPEIYPTVCGYDTGTAKFVGGGGTPLTYSVPSGYIEFDIDRETTLGDEAHGTNVTFDAAHLKATFNDAGWETTVADSTWLDDRRYFEVILTNDVVPGTDDASIGLTTGDVLLNNWLGNTGDNGHSFGYFQSGEVWYAGVQQATWATWAQGDNIGVDVDITSETASFYKNGVFAGTFDYGTAGLPSISTVFPAMSGRAVGNIMDINFGGAPFAYSPPSGSNGWDGQTTVATGMAIGAAIKQGGMRSTQFFTEVGGGSGLLSSDGKAYKDGTGTFLDTFTSGDVIGVAYDSDTRKIWYRKNATWLGGGDPGAGTGEVHTLDDDIYHPALTAFSSTDTEATIFVNQQELKHDIPDGFLTLEDRPYISHGDYLRSFPELEHYWPLEDGEFTLEGMETPDLVLDTGVPVPGTYTGDDCTASANGSHLLPGIGGFFSVDGYVELPSGTQFLDSTQDFTVVFWARRDGPIESGRRMLVCFRSEIASHPFVVWEGSEAGEEGINFGWFTGGSTESLRFGSQVGYGEHTMYSFHWDGTAGEFTGISIKGGMQSRADITSDTPPTWAAPTIGNWIGYSPTGTYTAFPGDIGSVSIFSKNLTYTEIGRLHAAALANESYNSRPMLLHNDGRIIEADFAKLSEGDGETTKLRVGGLAINNTIDIYSGTSDVNDDGSADAIRFRNWTKSRDGSDGAQWSFRHHQGNGNLILRMGDEGGSVPYQDYGGREGSGFHVMRCESNDKGMTTFPRFMRTDRMFDAAKGMEQYNVSVSMADEAIFDVPYSFGTGGQGVVLVTSNYSEGAATGMFYVGDSKTMSAWKGGSMDNGDLSQTTDTKLNLYYNPTLSSVTLYNRLGVTVEVGIVIWAAL